MITTNNSDALRFNPIQTLGSPTTPASVPPPPPINIPSSSNSKSPNNDKSSLHAAAELIQTLDTAFVEMNTLAASSARDADEARKNARAASEVARRFRKKSFPTDMMSGFDMLTREETKLTMTTTTSATVNGDPDATSSNNYANAENQSSSSSSAGWRKPYNARSPSSSVERLAESHAEDVLSLSLELERAKQAHETDKKTHEETKSHLAEEKSRNAHLEQQIQKLLNDMETQRESHGRQVDSLEKELQRAKLRVEAAEEDAQLALDLAKGNAESREQVESWLQRALMEVQVLREQIVPGNSVPAITASQEAGTAATTASGMPQTPQTHQAPQTPPPPAPLQTPESKATATSSAAKRSVRFAESPVILSESTRLEEKQQQREKEKEKETQIVETVKEDQIIHTPTKEPQQQLTTPTRVSRPSRSSVAAGRHLLQRSLGKDDSSEHSFEYTPERSAERRRRFREHIKRSGDLSVSPSPTTTSIVRSPRRVHEPTLNGTAVNVCRSAIKLLQASAKRLGLGGHWWRDHSRSDSDCKVDSLEALTRQYCQSVEVKIERQKSEIKELESLCAFLEQRMATSDFV